MSSSLAMASAPMAVISSTTCCGRSAIVAGAVEGAAQVVHHDLGPFGGEQQGVLAADPAAGPVMMATRPSSAPMSRPPRWSCPPDRIAPGRTPTLTGQGAGGQLARRPTTGLSAPGGHHAADIGPVTRPPRRTRGCAAGPPCPPARRPGCGSRCGHPRSGWREGEDLDVARGPGTSR